MVLIRIGCVALFAPFFASEAFPARFRLLFVGSLSLLLLPAAARTAEIPPVVDMLQLGLLAIQEVGVGMAIGFLATLVFTGTQLAGEIAGQQIGFSMANVIDPISNVQVPLLGFINMQLTIALFLAAKLHLVFLYIMVRSYEYVAIGALAPEAAMAPVWYTSLEQARAILVLGVQLAIPIMLIMLLNSVVEGFVTKTMPQMNLMVFGMPLRVLLGVSALIFIYPAICVALAPPDWAFNLRDVPEGALGDMLYELSVMVRGMGEGGAAPAP